MNPSSFTFSKFLSGAYKTLNVANQIIPLYKHVSPMIKNARNVFSIISEINKSNKPARINYSKSKKNSIHQKKELSLNNPVFFVGVFFFFIVFFQ